MAICRIIETGAKPKQYEQVRAHLGLGDAAPPGAMVHIAAIGDDGLMRVIEVWESRDQAEAFAEKVIEARTEIGIAPVRPQIQYLEVHKIAQDVGATA